MLSVTAGRFVVLSALTCSRAPRPADRGGYGCGSVNALQDQLLSRRRAVRPSLVVAVDEVGGDMTHLRVVDLGKPDQVAERLSVGQLVLPHQNADRLPDGLPAVDGVDELALQRRVAKRGSGVPDDPVGSRTASSEDASSRAA
jgi:hypothetical protein